MSFGLFKSNITYKLFVYKLYICKQDLALNNPQKLICYKTQPNQMTTVQKCIFTNR